MHLSMKVVIKSYLSKKKVIKSLLCHIILTPEYSVSGKYFSAAQVMNVSASCLLLLID